MKVALINPPMVGQINDYLGHIPYQPVGLLYIASYLQAAGVEVEFIDCFGESPYTYQNFNEKISLNGLFGMELLKRIPGDCDLIGISCLYGAQHSVVVSMLQQIKSEFSAPVVIGGDHATIVASNFIEDGADFVIRGEGEFTTLALLESLNKQNLLAQIPGLLGENVDGGDREYIKDLDALPFPAFDLLELENYWNLKDAHGPLIGRYLVITTSRGCPYDCNFCASPALSKRLWRARSAENVVEEMEFFHQKFGVTDFQVEEANFSVNRKRVLEIAERIIKKGLPISYSLPSGIKGETIEVDDLDILATSGLHYFHISPESGSKKVLKLMNKKCDFDHMRSLVVRAHSLGISTGASFIIGYPGETDDDRKKTQGLILDYTRKGLDEVAVFMMYPLPGTEASNLFEYNKYDLLSKPSWREDFGMLTRWKNRIMLLFYLTKLIYHPVKVLRNVYNTLIGRSQIKGEMIIRRAIKLRLENLRRRLPI